MDRMHDQRQQHAEIDHLQRASGGEHPQRRTPTTRRPTALAGVAHSPTRGNGWPLAAMMTIGVGGRPERRPQHERPLPGGRRRRSAALVETREARPAVAQE